MRVLAVLLFLALSLTAARCDANDRPEPIENGGSGVRYFAGISGLSHPFTLDHEMSADEALRSGKYFRGTFTEGRLSRLERYIDGKIFFVYEYSYHPGGQIARATIRSEGEEERIFDYDEQGRLTIEENRGEGEE